MVVYIGAAVLSIFHFLAAAPSVAMPSMFYVHTFYVALAGQGLRQPFVNAVLWLAFPDLPLGQRLRQLSVLGLFVGEFHLLWLRCLRITWALGLFHIIITAANPQCV